MNPAAAANANRLPGSSEKILIAGIGNIFLGDDAFGVEVVRRLAGRSLPPQVRVVDFGIRGIDLTFALLDDVYDTVILVDAAPRGEMPGTLYVIEPDWRAHDGQNLDPGQVLPIDTHALDPERVLRAVSALGGRPKRLLLVGCEPTPLDPELDPPLELSPPVLAAVDEAVVMVESLVNQLCPGVTPGVLVAEPLMKSPPQNGR